MRLTWIVAFSLLVSAGALSGAGILLAFPKLHERLKALYRFHEWSHSRPLRFAFAPMS
jgi:hypothetical protein